MSSRDVKPGKTKRALAKLRRAVASAEEGGTDARMSQWEEEFAESVESRLETFGSAFTDPTKGRLDEPLSVLQTQKLNEIARKTRKAAQQKRQHECSADAKGHHGRSRLQAPKSLSRRARSLKPSPSRMRDVDQDLNDDESS